MSERRRSWVRWVGGAVALVAALVVLAVAAARLRVGSDRGRRTVEHKVDEAVATHLGGHVHIGAIRGTLVGGVTLDDVVWRDDAGRPALRARRVVARYSAASALAKRPSLELRVEAPDVDLDRLARGVDLDEAARLLEKERDRVDAVTLSRVEIVDGTIRVGGQTLERVSLRAHGHVDKNGQGRLGDAGALELDEARARAELGGVPVTLGSGGALRWDRAAGRFAADGLAVRMGASSARASATIDRGGVDARLASLRIAPEDLRRLSPLAPAPRTPITGEARLHGPLAHATIDGELRPDRGRVALDGVVDLRARRGQVSATLADVESDYSTAVIAGRVTLRGALARGRLVVDGRGDGHYFRRVLDPNLQLPTARVRDLAPVRPGGRFDGRGRLVARLVDERPAAELRFRLRVVDPGRAARLLAGPDLRNAAAPVVVDGTWTLAPHHAPTLSLTQKR